MELPASALWMSGGVLLPSGAVLRAVGWLAASLASIPQVPGKTTQHVSRCPTSLGANSWEVRLLLCGRPKPRVLSSRLTNSLGPRHSTWRCRKHRELDLTPVVLLYMTGCPVGLTTRQAAGAPNEELRGPALELWGSGLCSYCHAAP